MTRRVWIVGLVMAGIATALPQRATAQPNPDRVTRRVSDGTATATLEVVPAQVLIADPIHITATVDVPQDTTVRFPDFDALGFSVFEQADNVPRAGSRIWIRKLVLLPLKAGQATIPSLEFEYSTPGNSGIVAFEPISITVRSTVAAEADPLEFREIEDVVELQTEDTVWQIYVWAFLAALLAVAGYLLMRLLRNEKSVSPETWARQRLAALRAEQTAGVRDPALDIEKLVGLAREYFERRLSVRASSTSAEFLDDSRVKEALNSDHHAALARLLETADQGKFALSSLTKQDVGTATDEFQRMVARIETNLHSD